ncbi:preprotein translocase subunit SecE [Spiroplasma endosymbiont of Aspidapion aeneum]|uniref:preprotein translocase subunit SecE n=1 Tax=Spiroplasma endosymbiont of Aspidapion aeneum TaxID=3066276 RepID=UPI00313B5A1F
MADFIDDVINDKPDNEKTRKKKVRKARTIKTKVKLSREEKLRSKFEKLKAKESYIKSKKEEKIIRKHQNQKKGQELLNSLKDDNPESKKLREKLIKDEKFKTEKKKRNASLYFREWPIKMVKEVQKIRWASRRDVAIKFFWVIVFILIFGAIFYFADWGISTLFLYIKII